MKIKAKHNDTRFCVIDEEDISGDLDKALRKSLVVCFPADREYFHRQSWWRCVPVYRVIGKDDKDSITAQVAVVERSVTVGRDLLKGSCNQDSLYQHSFFTITRYGTTGAKSRSRYRFVS